MRTGDLTRFLAAFFIIIGSQPVKAQLQKALAFQTLPTSKFTENNGQVTDQHGRPQPEVKYIYAAPGMKVIFRENCFSYELYTTEKQAPISESTGMLAGSNLPNKFKVPEPAITRTHRIDITLPGSARRPHIEALGKSADYNNFYLGHTPEAGIVNVNSYTQLTYRNIWPKVDLVFYARKEGELKYDIVLHPGAKMSDVKFAYSGMKALRLEDGKLKLATIFGDAEESIPLSYLKENGHNVQALAHLNKNTVSFSANEWNGKQTLVIDPILKWATYYGGNHSQDEPYDVTTDASGNIIIGGLTSSSNGIATSGAHMTTYSFYMDAFLVKFSSNGSRLWGTYYGATGPDYFTGLGTDGSGNIIGAGYTSSTSGIATSGAYQTSMAGATDAFIVKFNSSGSRQWGTYYGTSQNDFSNDVAVDGSGNIIIVGSTNSTSGLATTGAHQTSSSGSYEAFIVKFNSSGSRQWGTYYGGSGYDLGYGISIDGSGNIYACGAAPSTSGIATSGAYQSSSAGNTDAFIVKFNSSGNRQWGTYYGGSDNDQANSLAIDKSGNILATGFTYSTGGIATSGAYQTSKAVANDAFVVKFSNSGSRLWGTYFGGNNIEVGASIAVDGNGSAYITGYTNSTSGIASSNAYQKSYGGNTDAFIAKFTSSGTQQWSTYYGGSGSENSEGVATDVSGNLFFTGNTQSSSGIATTGAHQTTLVSGADAYLVKFYDGPTNDVSLNSLPAFPTEICQDDSINLNVVLENKTTDADSNIRIKVLFQGPDNIMVTDSLMKKISGSQKDTLNFTKTVRLTTPGTYTVTVFRDPKDYNPNNDTLRRKLIVRPKAYASFIAANECEGKTVTLVNGTVVPDSTAVNYLWELGDGDTSTSVKPSKIYNKAGTYIIRLYVTTDKGCTDSTSRSITIYPKALADFSVSDACVGENISIDNNSVFPAGEVPNYGWEFGDGTVSRDSIPVKSYSTPGNYTIRLAVMTSNRCVDTISHRITIHPRPIVSFTATDVCAGNDIGIRNTSSTPADSIAGWLWKFGDGNTSKESNPTKSYATSGTYTIWLYATTKGGCTDSTSTSVTIFPRVQLSFTAADVCIGDTTVFTNNTAALPSGNISSWLWRFGDGNTSSSRDTVHKYTAAGTYTATLLAVTDKGCTDSITKTITVQPLPVAGFSYVQKNGYNVQFTPDDAGQTSYRWDFGGGSTSTDKNPIHDFGKAGNFSVTLKVTSPFGCVTEKTQNVVINLSSVSEAQPIASKVSIYPNPFKDHIMVMFRLSRQAGTRIELVDMTGRQVLVKEIGYQQAGDHTVSLNTSESSLQPGFYLLRILAGDLSVVQSVIKIGQH